MNIYGNSTTKHIHGPNINNSLNKQLFRALSSDYAEISLREMDEVGTLTTIFPELEAGRGFVQPTLHYYNVLDHNLCTVGAFDRLLQHNEWGEIFRKFVNWEFTIAVLEKRIDEVPIRTLLRLGCLLHDVGKPISATTKNGRLVFPKHGIQGFKLIYPRLGKIGLGENAIQFVGLLIRYHLRAGLLARSWPPNKQAIESFKRDIGGWALPILLVQLADGIATKGPYQTLDRHYRHCEFFSQVLKLCE